MAPRAPTDLCITVDVEFSIAGTFEDPRRFKPLAEPVVACRVNGEGHGLDFLLRTLAAHGQRATFFVETLCTLHFGDEPMRSYARRIAEAGHEVGLHLHPCWQVFRFPDWPDRVRRPLAVSDTLCDRPPHEVEAVIANGMAVMERWGLPRPRSLRMGNLMADRGIYRAMRRLGLTVASNIGLGIHRSGDPSLHLAGGAHQVEGVVELPVLTYDVGLPLRPSRRKCLTTTGTGLGTTLRLLRAARAAGSGPVVLLTHPFEFVKRRDFTFRDLRPNRINQRRLADLCAFVAAHPSDFRMATVSDAAACAPLTAPARVPAPPLDVEFVSVLPGLVSNRLNDLVWRL